MTIEQLKSQLERDLKHSQDEHNRYRTKDACPTYLCSYFLGYMSGLTFVIDLIKLYDGKDLL